MKLDKKAELMKLLWHADGLLGNDRETNVTTAIVRQQLRKYATLPELLLGIGPRAKKEVLLETVIFMWSATRLYHSNDRVEFS
jgi:hypothetical protein